MTERMPEPAPASMVFAPRLTRGFRRHGVLGGTARAVKILLRPVLTPLAARRLRRKAASARDLNELVEIAFEFDSYGVQLDPGQVRSEISGLLELLADQGPRRILEIGTKAGGSLFLIAQVVDPDALILSVDLPGGEFGGGYPAWRGPLYRRFGKGQRIELIRGDSHAPETFDRVCELLGGEQLDFLFIDGDHTYEGVRQDFEIYSPLMAPGGLVAFHDIAPGNEGQRTVADGSELLGGDVPGYWRQLRSEHRTTELIDSEQGFFGIGVVHWDERGPAA